MFTKDFNKGDEIEKVLLIKSNTEKGVNIHVSNHSAEWHKLQINMNKQIKRQCISISENIKTGK